MNDLDLAGLLADGEDEVFHGRPAAAIGVLEQAIRRAGAQGLPDELAGGAWLLGVALAALGRQVGALSVLGPVVDTASRPDASVAQRRCGSLASATIAGVQRQVGRHTEAREADLRALALADGLPEAAVDAHLGLATDAVGLDDVEQAVRQRREVVALLPQDGGQWWRQRLRLGWVTAEIALLEGHPDAAVRAAAEATEQAEQARAPRHVARSLLLRGIAEVGAAHDGAADTLLRAATLAETLDALPLVWPARALLGALLGDEGHLAAARAAVLRMASHLPPDVRSQWLRRPELSALFSR